MVENLAAEGVLFLRHVANFFQQREIGIRLDITGDTGIAIPIPGTAEIRRGIDDANILDAGLSQADRGQQSAKTTPEHQHLDLVVQGLTLETRLRIGIAEKMRKFAFDLDVLLVPIIAKPSIALFAVFLAQGGRIEFEFPCVPLPDLPA